MEYRIKFYKNEKGKVPFDVWLTGLSNDNQTRVAKRISRVELGNLGDYKRLGSDLYEFRFDFGSGYRVYFSIKQDVIILLLIGGDKASQKRDINKAREYLEDYNEKEID